MGDHAGCWGARPGVSAREAALRTHRVLFCGRCRAVAHVCNECDRGQIYCAGECASARRRRSVREAGRRYQERHPGRRRHAARQQRYRERLKAGQKVTHQGSPAVGVSAQPNFLPSPPASEAVPASASGVVRCSFCGKLCSGYVRLWRAAGSRRRRATRGRRPQGACADDFP
jgi:hypothetical protein